MTSPVDPAREGMPPRRSRRLLAVAATGSALVLAAVALGGGWAYSAARPASCEAVQRADLTLGQMVSVKQRIDRHERGSERPLALSPEEASFVLNDNLEYPVWITAEGDRLGALLALPERGDASRCYNIQFEGHVEIDDGIAVVVPTRLVVGHLDLSSVTAGRRFAFDASFVEGDHASAMLAQTRQLRVVDGALIVDIDDVGSLR